MDEDIERLDQARYRMLRGIYKATKGDTRIGLEPDDFTQIVLAEEILPEEAPIILRYLCSEGLVEQHAFSLWGITHEGVREYEQSRRRPNDGTEHFSATVINNVINISGGNIGAVQAGDGNTAHVVQHINPALGEVVPLIDQLRQAAEKLEKPEREAANELIDGIEEQTKSKTPKTNRVKAYAEMLKAILPDAVSVIAMIVRIFLAKDSAQLPP